MHRIKLLIFVIGIIWTAFAYADGEDDEEIAYKNHMVIVDQANVVTTEVDHGTEFRLAPYLERRGSWSFDFGLGYSSFEPRNYEPNFAPADQSFSDIYGTHVGMLEVGFQVRKNISLGSIGGEFVFGSYTNRASSTTAGGTSLSVMPLRIGAVYMMDALARDSIFVPYIAGGGYISVYKESLNGNSDNGTTKIAPYVHGGLAVSLDWIDRASAIRSYQESGMQRTYFYLELQKLIASSEKKDPDFSNTVDLGAGFRAEF